MGEDMPMNSSMLDQGMPMQAQGMPMQVQMPMQAQMPMQGNLPNLNQNQVNNILSKLPPNYNGPIDMIGGSNEIELEYALNDNMSSGQKNKRANQIGGNGRIIPKYVGTKNTPFKSQDTKNIEKTRFNEIPSYVKDSKNTENDQ